ncbi:hypothetical protein Ancab_012941 [Ancistrocladus abbreviatus]
MAVQATTSGKPSRVSESLLQNEADILLWPTPHLIKPQPSEFENYTTISKRQLRSPNSDHEKTDSVATPAYDEKGAATLIVLHDEASCQETSPSENTSRRSYVAVDRRQHMNRAPPLNLDPPTSHGDDDNHFHPVSSLPSGCSKPNFKPKSNTKYKLLHALSQSNLKANPQSVKGPNHSSLPIGLTAQIILKPIGRDEHEIIERIRTMEAQDRDEWDRAQRSLLGQKGKSQNKLSSWTKGVNRLNNSVISSWLSSGMFKDIGDRTSTKFWNDL